MSLEDDFGIHSAASSGNISSLALMLESNNKLVNEVNQFGMTPLHGAAFHNQLEAARILLDSGADANRPSSGLKFTFPLHLAVIRLNKQLIELLIVKGGADLACKDYLGHTVFDVAQGISVDSDSVAKDPDTNILMMNFIKECTAKRKSDQTSKSFIFESKHSANNKLKGPVIFESASDSGDYDTKDGGSALNNDIMIHKFNSEILQ